MDCYTHTHTHTHTHARTHTYWQPAVERALNSYINYLFVFIFCLCFLLTLGTITMRYVHGTCMHTHRAHTDQIYGIWQANQVRANPPWVD